MKIEQLVIQDFRNYSKQIFNPGSQLNFLIGLNGEGKTNLLESIYVLGLSKSYRSDDEDLIRFQTEFAKIKALVMTKDRKTELQIVLSEVGKKVLVNGQEIKRLSDYVGNLNIVLFAPEDLNLVKGSPNGRRYFFDIILGQIDKQYLKDLSDYKYILKQRNEFLKQSQSQTTFDERLLDVLTEQLAGVAEKIIQTRKLFIESIGKTATENYQFLATKKDSLSIVYLPSIQESVFQSLKMRYKSDIYQGMTTYGPHRDDYDFFISDHSAKGVASQGEQRLMVLAVNLALIDYISKQKNDKPIFLLDDVLSELDSEKQNRLLRFILNKGGQTIITATGLPGIENDILQQSKLFRVVKGYIKEDMHHGQ